MKKAEELKLYAPEPKRPELDAALCMSVAEGQGMGRYIEGKVLTVAVWDKKEKPLVVWRFFGDYWTGELRGNENPTKGELSPRQIEVKPCQCLTWRTEVPATKGESELLQNYFDDCRPGYLIGIVEDLMNLIREIFFSPMVVDAAGIILIVAALPMVGWSWAVSHMAGPKVKNAKEGT